MKKILVLVFIFLCSCGANQTSNINTFDGSHSSIYEANINEKLPAPFTVEALEAAFVEYVNYYSYYYPEDNNINLYQDRMNDPVNIEIRDYSQPVYQKNSNKFEVPVIYGVDKKTGDYISF